MKVENELSARISFALSAIGTSLTMFEESAMRLKVFIPPPGELEIHLWSDTYKVR